MADVTNLFKATVKAVKARRKALKDDSRPDTSILSTKKPKGEFTGKAKGVLNNITELRSFLSKHRKEYINTCNHVNSDLSKMTDAERDQIDADAQTFMRTCSSAIKHFREEIERDAVADQVRQHREAVLQLLDVYLKGVCKMYSEQRAVRVKRVVDRKRIGRLEPEAKKARSRTPSGGKDKLAEKDKKTWEAESSKAEVGTPSSDSSPVSLLGGFDDDDDEDMDELSPEEAQMYEEENQQLYEEMNSIVDEVRQIEGKVVEISRLQEIFSEKVLEQEKDIDRIADTVVGTTENIKVANEEIRQAMKNNAGLRVWILFFLIVCSFSLLFLDWYNT